MLRPALLAASLFVLLSCRPEAGDRNTSGGPLSARQAAFDVTYYDLSLRIDPDARRIEGVLRLDARLTAPLDSLELDLDDRLVVSAVRALPSLALVARDGRRGEGGDGGQRIARVVCRVVALRARARAEAGRVADSL